MLTFPRERGTFPNESGMIRGRSDGRRDAFDLHEVEVAPTGIFVDPGDRAHMLRAGVGRNPDGNLRVQDGKVRQDLSKMLVVGLLQLVLDRDPAAVLVLREEVRAEVPGALFPLYRRESDPQDITEHADVLLQPRGEVVGFVVEHITGREPLEGANLFAVSHLDVAILWLGC